MTGHDAAFAAMQARKAAEKVAAPARVTWRKVSDLTGGGYSGLGRDGRLAWVATHGASYVYGVVTDDGSRIRVNATVAPLATAKKRAAVLVAYPVPALSARQRAVLECLCAATRAGDDCIHNETGARPGTLAALLRLDLILATAAGGRQKLYHLTDLGRATILCAVNTESEGGPTMTDTATLTDDLATDATPDPKPESKPRTSRSTAAAQAVAAKDAAADAVEDVTGKPNAAAPKAKKAGANDATKTLFDDIVKAAKAAVGRGVQTEDKSRYRRLRTKDGKTVAYINFPSGKHVRCCIPHPDGEVIVKAADAAGLAAVVTAVEGRLDRIKTAQAAKA